MRFKNIKLAFGILFILLQSGCYNLNKNIAVKDAEVNSLSTLSVANDLSELDESSKFSIYKSVLTYMAKEVILTQNYQIKDKSSVTVYRTETIKPPDNIEINDFSPVSPTLLDSFIKSNQKTENIERAYDILTAHISSNSGDRDLIKFYESTKRKYRNTKSVVAFSNVGVDENRKQGLVYVEFCDSNKKPIKMYLLMKFYKDEQGLNPNSVNGISDVKQVFINE